MDEVDGVRGRPLALGNVVTWIDEDVGSSAKIAVVHRATVTREFQFLAAVTHDDP